LWAQVGEWTVIVFPFIDGQTGSHLGMTDGNWQEVGMILNRNDLGEETKAEAVQLPGDIFAEGGEVDAAKAAAAHLPSDLSFHNIVYMAGRRPPNPHS
jgi:hypothetical protein